MPSHTDDATLSPADLEALGLLRQPFADNGFFFADEAIEASLNLALNIIQSTGRLLIVAGPKGVGRSAFLRELAARSGGVACSGVRGGARTDLARLLAGLDAEGPTSVLERLRDAPQRHALLVDDADRLPRQVLEQLLDCHEAVTIEGVEWPLVLACDVDNLEEIERALVAHGYDEDLTQTLHLIPLSPIQTAGYVRARLVAAGDSGGELLDERDLRRIHQRSGGLPADIHTVTAALLRPTGERPGPIAAVVNRVVPTRLPGRSSITFLIVLAAMASIVIGVLLSLWLHQEETARETIPLTVVQEEAPVAATPGEEARTDVVAGAEAPAFEGDEATAPTTGTIVEQPGEPAAAPETPTTPPSAAAEPEIDETDPDASGSPVAAMPDDEPAGMTPAPTDDAPELTAPADDPAEPGDPSDAASGQAAESLPSADTTASAQATEPQPVEPTGTTERPTTWIDDRPDDRFTIQLIGGRERSTVERFFGEVGEDERLHVIESRRDGSPWLVVVTGDYPSSEAAREAMASLPSAWRQYGAFPRSFGSLRD